MLELQSDYDELSFVVGGDFNARVGEENVMRGEVGEIEKTDSLALIRHSKDKVLNAEGKKLLDFCEKMGLEILNGTHGQDKEGNFTYIGVGGASTIDYILCSHDILPYVKDFYVDIRSESDHLPVILQLQMCNSEKDRIQCTELRKKFNTLKAEKIDEWKNRTMQFVTNALETGDPTRVWHMLKRLRGCDFVSNSITAVEWVRHFKIVLGGEQRRDTRIELPCLRLVDELDSPFLPHELQEAIKKLKNNKAPGFDGIPGEIFKLACENNEIFNSILRCCNEMFISGKYYSGWETSIIHTIYKNKGSVESADNYRGIALAPVMSKIYSSLIHARLLPWALKNNKISLFQAGFRPGYSTTDNLFVLDHLIKKYLSKKKGKLYCAFVDFQKAFDTVDRQILWQKLWDMGCSSRMISALMG
ncbi:hypothetical protein B566_EDAN017759, partial [Ephemera danica]